MQTQHSNAIIAGDSKTSGKVSYNDFNSLELVNNNPNQTGKTGARAGIKGEKTQIIIIMI